MKAIQPLNNTRTTTAALVDAPSLAATLSLTPQGVWRLHRLGKIPSVRLGHRCLRFSPAAVLRALGVEGAAD